MLAKFCKSFGNFASKRLLFFSTLFSCDDDLTFCRSSCFSACGVGYQHGFTDPTNVATTAEADIGNVVIHRARQARLFANCPALKAVRFDLSEDEDMFGLVPVPQYWAWVRKVTGYPMLDSASRHCVPSQYLNHCAPRVASLSDAKVTLQRMKLQLSALSGPCAPIW